MTSPVAQQSVVVSSARWLLPMLIVASLLTLVVSLAVGATSIDITDLLAALFGAGSNSHNIILWEIRLPRSLAAFAVGAALGASGAALQGLLRNPLAEPGVLGVSASASLGATLALFFGWLSVSGWVLPFAAVVGALTATVLLSWAARKVTSMVTLILIGVGLSSFAGAIMALLMNLSPNPFTLADMVNWMLGTVSNRSLADLGFAMPFLLAGAVLLGMSRRSLTVLTLGEEAAVASGLDIKRLRVLVIAGAGLATGAAVSLAGAIGFVGIIAPHIVRPWVAHRAGDVVWPAAWMAGLMLLIADTLIRLAPGSTELKLGVVAALIGAPIFVWIASQRGRHSV